MSLRIRSKPGAGSYHSWWSLRMRQQLVVISGQRIYLGAPKAVMAGGPDGAPVELLCQTEQPVKSYATHGEARTPAGIVFGSK